MKDYESNGNKVGILKNCRTLNKIQLIKIMIIQIY